MSGDNFTEDVPATRVALGDLTNRSLKRGISSISDELGSGDENLRLAKLSCKTMIGANTGDERDTLLEKDNQASDSSATDTDLETSQGNAVPIISNIPNENEVAPNLLNTGANLVTRDPVTKSFDEIGDGSRDSCASTGSLPACSWPDKKDSDEEGKLSDNLKQKNPPIDVCISVEKDLDGGGLASNSCGAVDWSKLPNSQGFRSLDRCSTLKGDGCANLDASADLLKACNCSFCMKAAYIWSDLHYQDIKGRLASLKKSRKEASSLANKYTRGKQTDIHSNRSSNLESDLTAQWKSLFHRMEDIFVHESNQLQAGYAALKDLRENCKMDLERTTGVPSNKF